MFKNVFIMKYNKLVYIMCLERDLYEILITFQTKEKTKKKLIIKIEYIKKESNESVFNFSLTQDPPFNLEEIKKMIFKRIIN